MCRPLSCGRAITNRHHGRDRAAAGASSRPAAYPRNSNNFLDGERSFNLALPCVMIYSSNNLTPKLVLQLSDPRKTAFLQAHVSIQWESKQGSSFVETDCELELLLGLIICSQGGLCGSISRLCYTSLVLPLLLLLTPVFTVPRTARPVACSQKCMLDAHSKI